MRMDFISFLQVLLKNRDEKVKKKKRLTELEKLAVQYRLVTATLVRLKEQVCPISMQLKLKRRIASAMKRKGQICLKILYFFIF